MASVFSSLREELNLNPTRWLVTGAAGFIGSHLAEWLLKNGQFVTALDNFATGHRYNLEHIRNAVGDEAWSRFSFIEGDISDTSACEEACKGATYVLHQAAIGSVPRSIEDPVESNKANVTGFLNVLLAARNAGCKRFVYASSSAVYGDDPILPKKEGTIGNPLSPYAVTKRVNELYASTFTRVYGLPVTGLRYFNVFGPRQDPNGAYAAVIPCWISLLVNGREAYINGDGETSRDFCYIDNIVQANILSAASNGKNRSGCEVFNVAVSERTTLNILFASIVEALDAMGKTPKHPVPSYRDFRQGDITHSMADIASIVSDLGYSPTHRLKDGLVTTVEWFAGDL